MPAWLVAALALLATFLGGGGRVPEAGGGIPFLPEFLDPFETRAEKVKRRRRRRALTQSDRNDIAFIAATIGKSAAGSFAVQLATRSR